MTQTDRAMVVQKNHESTQHGSVKIELDAEFLLSSVEPAISHALGVADSGKEISSGGEGETRGNHTHSAGNFTWGNRVATPDVNLPPLPGPEPCMYSFHALQEWEGNVVSIEDDVFVARLVDITAGMSHESEEATIPLRELSNRDAANMELGSIFRWVIGYERSPEGTQKRVSQIVFLDPPRMTKRALQASKKWASKMAEALNR